MKKLVFAAASIVAISLASCGNSNKQQMVPVAEVDEVTVAIVADTIAPDSVVMDTIVGISGTIIGEWGFATKKEARLSNENRALLFLIPNG